MPRNFLLFILLTALLVGASIWLIASCKATQAMTTQPSPVRDSTATAPTVEPEAAATAKSVDPTQAANATLQFYQGSVRMKAKTSISIAQTESFETVGALIASLTNDADMRQHDPKLRDNSPRCTEEERNVSIGATYIFAIKKEADGDFHVIIGDLNADGEKVNLMNAEISGLPATNAPNFETLHTVREALYGRFPAFFQSNGTRNKLFIRPPYPTVGIGGSLFFDIRHEPSQMGGMFAPQSVWEIHPITRLVFHR